MNKIDIINDQVSIKMELVEIEEYLPSFKMKVDITIYHPTGLLRYVADDIGSSVNIGISLSNR